MSKTYTVERGSLKLSFWGTTPVFDAVAEAVLEKIVETSRSINIALDGKQFSKANRYVLSKIISNEALNSIPSYHTGLLQRIMKHSLAGNFRRDRVLSGKTHIVKDILYIDNIKVLNDIIPKPNSGSTRGKQVQIKDAVKDLVAEVVPVIFKNIIEMPEEEIKSSPKVIRKAANRETAKQAHCDFLTQLFPEEELQSLVKAADGGDFNKFARISILQSITSKLRS